MKALQSFLRPEFLGRVDEVIAFNPLDPVALEKIAALMLEEYHQPMADKGVTFRYTPAALTVLVEKASGGKFGARDLRRTIRKQVEDPLAERLVDGTLGLDVTVDAQDGQIVLR